MKPVVFLWGLLFCVHCSIAQSSEFVVNNNGLIYPEHTVVQLKHIVDSLNLKFKRCELHTTYYSIPQGKVHFIEMEKDDVKAAMQDMANGMDFESFVTKYGPAEVERNKLAVKFQYKNYDGDDEVEFSTIALGNASSRGIRLSKSVQAYNKPLKNT